MTNGKIIKCSIFLGKPIEIKKESGKIINKDQWSETHVHGGGGGGNQGYNSPVSISSTVTNKSRIWLIDSDEKEFTWTLNNTNLGEREGHALSLARVKGHGGIAAYNHSLDKFEWWDSALSEYLSPPKLIGWAIIILPIIILWMTYSSAHFFSDVMLFSVGIFLGWGLVVGIFFGIFRYVRKVLFTMKYKSKIKSFLVDDLE